jgi:hypothetical protein
MARLPRLIGRGRALEVLLGADDIPGDLAELYGYVNRALPDVELDAFVDALAVRIAYFEPVQARFGIYSTSPLVLFTECLDVRLAIGIEEFLAALLPSSLEFGNRDVPIRPAFLCDGAKILTKVFERGTAEEPVAVVDLVYDKARFEDNDMWDHRIVDRIRIFGDVEILLNDTASV